MRASEFFRTYQSAKLSEWEAAVVELAKRGELAAFSWVDVPISGGGHTGVVRISRDVVSIGEEGDSARLPLTAPAAQAVLNVTGSLLPTKKLVIDINQAVGGVGGARVQPVTQWPNPGPNLESYRKHSQIIDGQLAQLGHPQGIVGGHKKDLVISNRTAAGKEMIYGWYATRPVPGVNLYTDSKGAQYIQPLSDIHEHGYVDYSHGIRAVFGSMIVDGKEMQTEAVYRDPTLAALVSDEGPIKVPRYDTRGLSDAPGGATPSASLPNLPNVSRKGLVSVYLDGLRAAYVLSTMRRRFA